MGLWVKRPSRRVVLGGRKAEGRRAGRNCPGPLQLRGSENTGDNVRVFSVRLLVRPSVCGGHNSPKVPAGLSFPMGLRYSSVGVGAAGMVPFASN